MEYEGIVSRKPRKKNESLTLCFSLYKPILVIYRSTTLIFSENLFQPNEFKRH